MSRRPAPAVRQPMAMLCWAVAEASPLRTVGLCHSVQHTAAELAADLGIPASEIDYHAAGINHAFFLRLERTGEDLYPALARVVEEGRVPDGNRVRYEVLRHLGYFVTESIAHIMKAPRHHCRRSRQRRRRVRPSWARTHGRPSPSASSMRTAYASSMRSTISAGARQRISPTSSLITASRSTTSQRKTSATMARTMFL